MTRNFDREAVRNAIDEMRRQCGGGDVPPRMVASTAHALKLSTAEFSEAAALLNRPFANNHAR